MVRSDAATARFDCDGYVNHAGHDGRMGHVVSVVDDDRAGHVVLGDHTVRGDRNERVEHIMREGHAMREGCDVRAEHAARVVNVGHGVDCVDRVGHAGHDAFHAVDGVHTGHAAPLDGRNDQAAHGALAHASSAIHGVCALRYGRTGRGVRVVPHDATRADRDVLHDFRADHSVAIRAVHRRVHERCSASTDLWPSGHLLRETSGGWSASGYDASSCDEASTG